MLKSAYARNNPNYGRGEHTIDYVDSTTLEDDLVAEVVKTFQSPHYEPPMLPTVAVQLLELSRRPDASTEELASLLESDPLLLARTLRLAQSVVFGAHPVKTTRDALIRLGRQRVADIVMAAALNMKVFRHDKYQSAMEAMRQHAQTTAVIAEYLANYVKVGGDYVFICALLHDVGAACTLILMEEIQPGLSPALLNRVLKRSHANVSGLLVALWGLPNKVEQVVAAHDSVSKKFDPLTAVITVSEHLATTNGVGWEDPHADTVYPRVIEAARKGLGLSAPEWRALERRAEAICNG